MRRSGLAVTLSTVALLGLAAVALESAARIWAPPAWAPLKASPEKYLEQVATMNQAHYRPETIDGVPWFTAANDHVKPPRFTARRIPGVRRVVVVGESSADMLGVAAYRLFGRDSDRLEIINLGVGGSTLEQSRAKLRKAMRYDPEAVVILFGNNLLFTHPASALAYRMNLLARKSAVITLLAERLFPLDALVSYGVRLGLLDQFLADAAAALRSRGVRLILCTVPTHRRFPPDVRPAELQSSEYQEALLLRDTGARRRGRDALRRLVTRQPTAWRNFVLARWLLEEKDYPEARRLFDAARDLDSSPGRATGAVNEIIRRAAVRDGAVLLDFETMVADMAPHGIPGWESFMDNSHVNPRLFDVEARALASELERLWPPLSILPGSDEPPYPRKSFLQILDTMIWSPDDRWMEALAGYFEHAFSGDAGPLEPELLSYRFRSGTDAVGWHLALAPLSAAEGAWRCGQTARALKLNALAAKAAPQWAEAPFRRGVYLLALGRRDEARSSFERALKLDPQREEARSRLAAIEGR